MQFITILTPDFLPGLFALLQSIKQNSQLKLSDCHFSIVHEEPISGEIQDGLKSIGIELTFVDRKELGDTPVLQNKEMEQFAYTFKKLLLFRFPHHGKLCFIDSDMLCLNALGNLSNLEHFSAAPDLGISEPEQIDGRAMINSGMMIYEPSEKLYQDIISYLLNSGRSFHPHKGDQEIVSCFFHTQQPKSIHLLDSTWNTLKRVKVYHPHLFNLDQIRFLHFVGAKPWQRCDSLNELVYMPLNRLWREYYNRSGGSAVLPDLPDLPSSIEQIKITASNHCKSALRRVLPTKLHDLLRNTRQ